MNKTQLSKLSVANSPKVSLKVSETQKSKTDAKLGRSSQEQLSPKYSNSNAIMITQKWKSVTNSDRQVYERMVYDQLVSLMGMILKSSSCKTTHDATLLEEHIQFRATESVDEALSAIMAKLELMQGPNQSHRSTAYSQLTTHLMNDLTSVVFSEDKKKLSAARIDQQSSKDEFARVHELLSLRVAKKDQTIQMLEADKVALDNKNKTLKRAVELLHKELEKTSTSLSETQQKAVELRMQGWDYKGEVDRRCQKIIASVQSRMGFVPSGIHKQISQLQVLKPPGDPAYDQVRNQTNRSNRGGRRCTGSSGDVKDSPSSLSLHTPSLSGFGLSRSMDNLHLHGTGQLLRSTSTESPLVARQNSDSSTRARGYSDEVAGNGMVSSSSVPFNKERFQQFLLQTAQDDRSSYLAKMDFLPRTTTASVASPVGLEHRRFSSTSSTSGCTDRRSSTSSVGGGGAVVSDLHPFRNQSSSFGVEGDDDADSAVGVSQHNLSVNLRKPWSFDNLLLQGDEDGQHTGSLHPKRVTTTAAAVPLSASSDMLDRVEVGDSSSQDSFYHREHLSYLQLSGHQPPEQEDYQYDEFVDLNDDDDDDDDDNHEGEEREGNISDGEVASVTSSLAHAPVHSHHKSHYENQPQQQQVLARDSAGAHALRKAGTVSPLQTTRKSPSVSR